jgi:hypothetical protein
MTWLGFQLGETDELDLLDYQVPLKARQADRGIGNIDLLGVTASGRIAVVELKVTSSSSKGDNPLRALLESLAYCAIVEANAPDISSEIENTFISDTAAGRPDLVVMGPTATGPRGHIRHYPLCSNSRIDSPARSTRRSGS